MFTAIISVALILALTHHITTSMCANPYACQKPDGTLKTTAELCHNTNIAVSATDPTLSFCAFEFGPVDPPTTAGRASTHRERRFGEAANAGACMDPGSFLFSNIECLAYAIRYALDV